MPVFGNIRMDAPLSTHVLEAARSNLTMNELKNLFLASAVVAVAGLTAVTPALAAGGHSGGHSMDIGERGDSAKADRTVEITMKDNYFEPEELKVKAGETVRFVVKNQGEFLHEFNIGTAAMHAKHQEEMATMMEHGMITPTKIDHEKMKMDHGGGHMMDHDDANSVLVEPGKIAELVWKFSETANLEFACNVPGHYDSGMMGEIRMGHGQ